MTYFQKLKEEIKAHGVDFAAVACGKNIVYCLLSTHGTRRAKQKESPWRNTTIEVDQPGIMSWQQRMRKRCGCAEKIQKTNAAVESSINLSNCGEVLESGWGKDPPNDIHGKQYALKQFVIHVLHILWYSEVEYVSLYDP